MYVCMYKLYLMTVKPGYKVISPRAVNVIMNRGLINCIQFALREHSSLRPFFAISYLRELKVCVWVSNVKKMN